MPRQLILGTAGHIDHGKTALVRALTGIDTDRLEEEKLRGISIDIGFAHLDLGEHHLGIVDVPGHERFIRNMLAGASGIDLAMLVVAADDSVMPQTLEHLAILKLLGIPRGLVVLSKIDLAEASWLDLVEEDIRELVKGSFLEGCPIVRTSATTGQGLDDLKQTLAELCAHAEDRPEEAGDQFRLAIDRAFVLQGLGTVVTGTVWSGTARIGDELALLPDGKTVRVRSLQTHGKDVECVTRGQRAAINLMGAHHSEIERGNELAAPGYLKPTRRMTVKLSVLPDSPWPIRHRARVRLHLGTQEVMAGVWLFDGKSVAPGETAFAQLNCADPVVATGRQPFVLRSESPLRTLGGGAVLQPDAARISRRDMEAVGRLDRLTSDDEVVRASTTIFFYGCEPWSVLDLCRDADLGLVRAEKIVNSLKGKGEIVSLTTDHRAGRYFHREVLEAVTKRILIALRKLHDESPLETSVPRRRLASRLNYLPGEVVLGLLDRLVETSDLVGDEQTVSLPQIKPKLSQTQMKLRERVIEAYQAGAFSPPDPAQIAAENNVNEKQLRPIIELCVGEKSLTHIEGTMFLHTNWEEELHRRMTEKLSQDAGLTVSDIRKLLDTSRKYAIPLCEYMDRIGLTERREDVRVLGKAANVIAETGISHGK